MAIRPGWWSRTAPLSSAVLSSAGRRTPSCWRTGTAGGAFPVGPGAFLLEGRPVTLVRPAPQRRPGRAPRRSAPYRSGRSSPGQQGQGRPGQRIYVEGGTTRARREDLGRRPARCRGRGRVSGRPDDLAPSSPSSAPAAERRLGGARRSPRARLEGEPHRRAGPLAARAGRGPPVRRHRAAVKPPCSALPGPVPMGTRWKEGVLAAIGWPADTAAA